MVERDDLKALRSKRVDERRVPQVKHAPKAVGQHDRLALADAAVGQLAATAFNEQRVGVSCACSLRNRWHSNGQHGKDPGAAQEGMSAGRGGEADCRSVGTSG